MSESQIVRKRKLSSADELFERMNLTEKINQILSSNIIPSAFSKLITAISNAKSNVPQGVKKISFKIDEADFRNDVEQTFKLCFSAEVRRFGKLFSENFKDFELTTSFVKRWLQYSAELVCKEIFKNFIEEMYEESYSDLPLFVRDILKASCGCSIMFWNESDIEETYLTKLLDTYGSSWENEDEFEDDYFSQYSIS